MSFISYVTSQYEIKPNLLPKEDPCRIFPISNEFKIFNEFLFIRSLLQSSLISS